MAVNLIPSSRRLPSELIEEILSNLPHKSLVRFTTVSKSWNSMIFEPLFARKQRNRAVLFRQHRLLVFTKPMGSGDGAAVFTLAPISSEFIRIEVTNTQGRYHSEGSVPLSSVFSNPNLTVRDYAGQFKGKLHLRAFCDELLCVLVRGHLFLWNPSMRNIVRLPSPSSFAQVGNKERDRSTYGLAYDSVNDDYKILKIRSRSELYSLKSHCWRKIKSFSSVVKPLASQRCAFVNGRFHWIGITAARARILESFELSTEENGVVALPPYKDDKEAGSKKLEVVTLRGMLCVFVHYSYYNDHVDEDHQKCRFVLWVMEEYGVEKSWNKRFDIMLPHRVLLNRCPDLEKLTPLDFSDNGDLLVKRHGCCAENMKILMYRNGEGRPMWDFIKAQMDEVDAFLYVESLIKIVTKK